MAGVVNTFTGGMNKDVNSMVAGQDILTDALNATIITYNGDEFVLQQDFGNGRVETAYLPKGYVPVGIKEYAGIIYVACYNPMNGLCQVGSFPSPERNISSEELTTLNNPAEFDISKQFSSIYEILSEDNIIRPGDKFSINLNIDVNGQKQEENDLLNLIYNYQTDESAANLVKFDLAIKTSDGNTIIITDKLKKVSIRDNDPYKYQKPNGTIDTKGTSKKNQLIPDDQYFYILEDLGEKIINPEPDGPKIKENNPEITGFWASTGKGSENLDDYRKQANENYLNVFNNKIAGQLVLIVSIPSIESFSISVNSTKSSNQITLNFIPKIEFADIRQMAWFGGFILQTEYKEEKDANFEVLSDKNNPSTSENNIEYKVYYVDVIGRRKTDDMPGSYDYLIKLKTDDLNHRQEQYKYEVKEENQVEEEKNKDITIKDKNEKTYTVLKNIFELTLRKNEIINNVSIELDDDDNFFTQHTVIIKSDSNNDSAAIGYIKYQAVPFMRYQLLPTYQINDIINVSLINSGVFSLTRWNWFTNVDKGIFNLRYGINAYNSSEVQFSQLLFYGYSLFDHIDDTSNAIYDLAINNHEIKKDSLKSDILFKSNELSSLKGTFTQTLYADNNFNMQDLYVVRIFVKTIKNVNTDWNDLINKPFENHDYYIENNEKNIRYYLCETRQFMTTSMFNQEYVNEYDTQKDFKDLTYKDIIYTITHASDTFNLYNIQRNLIKSENNKRYSVGEPNDFTASYNTIYNNNLTDILDRKILNYHDLLLFNYKFNFLFQTQNNYIINNNYFLPEMQENISSIYVKYIKNNLYTTTIDNNKNNFELNINVTENFKGKFSNPSTYKQKTFSPFYSVNTSNKIYGIKNKSLNRMLCCCVGTGKACQKGGNARMILIDMLYDTYKNIKYTDKEMILNDKISMDNVYLIGKHTNGSEDELSCEIQPTFKSCGGTMNIDIFDNNLTSVTNNVSIQLNNYSIIPIFFIGTKKNGSKIKFNSYTTTSIICEEQNLNRLYFTSALHTNTNTNFNESDFFNDTYYALLFNNNNNNNSKLITFIDKIQELDESNISYENLIGNLNNIYYYNDETSDNTIIYTLDVSVFQPYSFFGTINLKYNIQLDNYKDKPINTWISTFINYFNNDNYKYIKSYEIKTNYDYDYDYKINCNIKNYNTLIQYYTILDNLKYSINNIEGDFNKDHIYYYDTNNNKIYDLFENKGINKFSFLNGAQIDTNNPNKIICNEFDMYTSTKDACNREILLKDNNGFYALFSYSRIDKNNSVYMTAQFKTAGYVINNSTF